MEEDTVCWDEGTKAADETLKEVLIDGEFVLDHRLQVLKI